MGLGFLLPNLEAYGLHFTQICSFVLFYLHLFYIYTCALAWPGTVPDAGDKMMN